MKKIIFNNCILTGKKEQIVKKEQNWKVPWFKPEPSYFALFILFFLLLARVEDHILRLSTFQVTQKCSCKRGKK
jgi:hypothetical protein